MIPLRWVADECVSGSVVSALRASGQDVLFVAEGFSGRDDEFVLSLAISERRLLLTEDMGFGKLIRRLFVAAPGIVFIRIPPERAALKWPRVKFVIESYGERLFGRLVVIEEARTRARALQMVGRGT